MHSDELGELLTNHRIPLVVLEACQSAQADSKGESVASELLQRGVASGVAMSHSVLVELSKRFVKALYAELAKGQRVGQAMLAGQRALHSNPSLPGVNYIGGSRQLRRVVPPSLPLPWQGEATAKTEPPRATRNLAHPAPVSHGAGPL